MNRLKDAYFRQNAAGVAMVEFFRGLGFLSILISSCSTLLYGVFLFFVKDTTLIFGWYTDFDSETDKAPLKTI